MGAGSLIGVSSGKIIAQQASSRVRNAHRSVDKAFNLHLFRNLFPDLPNFFQRQLSCGYYPFCSLFPPEKISPVIGIICLSADMSFDVRTNLLCHLKNGWICNDQRIRLQFFQFFQIFFHSRKVIVMGQDINRYMYLCPMLVGKGNSFPHVILREIFGLCPQSEGLPANIYCICPKDHGSLQYLQAAGRY